MQQNNSISSKQTIFNEERSIPPGYEIDRRIDTVHGAVFKVIGAVTNLSREFHTPMTNGHFSKCVKVCSVMNHFVPYVTITCSHSVM